MSRVFVLAAGVGLLMFPQFASALPPSPTSFRPGLDPAILLADAQPAPTGTKAAAAWAQARLAEIDAVLATLDGSTQTLAADARKTADEAMTKLRASRDEFGAKLAAILADGGTKSKAEITEAYVALDAKWSDFERDLQAYLASIDASATLRSAVAAARDKAEELHWQQAIATLKEEETKVAAENRPEIDSAIAALQSYADAAKARLASLQAAGSDAWAAMWDGLAEARKAFDHAYEGVQAKIAPAAQPERPAK